MELAALGHLKSPHRFIMGCPLGYLYFMVLWDHSIHFELFKNRILLKHAHVSFLVMNRLNLNRACFFCALSVLS